MRLRHRAMPTLGTSPTILRCAVPAALRHGSRKPFRRRGLASYAPEPVTSLQLGSPGLDAFAKDIDGPLSRSNQTLPRFAADGRQIKLLREPTEFYRWLLVRRSSHEIAAAEPVSPGSDPACQETHLPVRALHRQGGDGAGLSPPRSRTAMR